MNIVISENLTISEAVQVFRIGRTRIYDLIRDGSIDAFKIGRRTLIRTESVRDFISTLPRAGDTK